MPYDSDTGLYERRSTTVIDASPDGDTVYVAIDAKLDLAADDTVIDLNHHATNGNHYPATSTADDSRFLRQSPSGTVSWANGVVAADAALKDFSNVASGAIAPAKIAQDASNRFFTDTERTKLEGIETGAQVNVAPSKAQVEAVLTGSISTHTHADASTTAKGLIEIATDAEVQAGTSTSLAVTPAGMKAGQIVLVTAQTASGLGVEFENIPSYAKRITVTLNGVSTNGISEIILQAGASSYLTTGYISQMWSGSTSSGVKTTGLAIFNPINATFVYSCVFTLSLIGGNVWVCSGSAMFDNATSAGWTSVGKFTLSGLSKIKITTINGTDTFDAGTINISWE